MHAGAPNPKAAPGDAPAADAWAPYRPAGDAPWDLRRVVHLHHRAGFAATWGEIRRDLADGPEAAVARLLEGRARPDGVPAEFEQRAAALADGAVADEQIERLQAAWLYRMMFTPDPLGERLTLCWHNHFATGHAKVKDVGMMRRQNDAQRALARAPFGDLLAAMLRDPALLVWLDAPLNRKDSPNENLGRELLELFTLGVGNYTEEDVREASRALTGCSVGTGGAFRLRPDRHDGGEKTVLGQRGPWGPDDLRRILLEHPATARRLAGRVCEQFMGEGVVSEDALSQLAAVLRPGGLDVGRAVGTVLRSALFFSDRNIATRVLAPAEFVVGAVRALELFGPAPPSTLALAEWMRRLGQHLFDPPNVGGWSGGRAWLSPRAAVARGNFAAALVAGELSSPVTPTGLEALAARHGAADAGTFFRDLLLGGRGELAAGSLGDAVALMIGGPEGQLG